MRDEDHWLELRVQRMIRDSSIEVNVTYEAFAKKHGLKAAEVRAFMNNHRKLGASIATMNKMLAPFRKRLSIMDKERWED